MRLALLALVTAAAVPAQNYIETFSYPNGPTVPLWTQQNLTWAIQNQRLVPTGGRGFHYITNDLFKQIGDCVLDVDVFYPPAVSLHYGGVCARHPGGPGEAGLVMVKLQDNSSGGNYNTMWMYERPGGAQAISPLPQSTLAGTVRMIVKGSTSWQQLDSNMDGTFDVKGAARPFAAATTNANGLIGICGYNGAEMDNWKYFEGVLLEDVGSSPKIGTTYTMVFSAPLGAAGVMPWAGTLSLGKTGIPLPGGRRLPQSLDALFNVSVGIGIGGLLTTMAPEAKFNVPIPNMPALIGLTVYACGLGLDGARPLGIGAISNDHGFTIQ